MRLLADECCSAPLVKALRTDGHDVCYAADEASVSPDAVLLARSVTEARVLLTEDLDYRKIGAKAPSFSCGDEAPPRWQTNICRIR